MIMYLRTDAPTCELWLDDTAYRLDAGRTLAHGLLGFIEECLQDHGLGHADIDGLVVFRGPGSFTGLRIGITVMNTFADGLSVPIVGTNGERWREDGAKRLTGGEDDTIVTPEYGGDAHITPSKK